VRVNRQAACAVGGGRARIGSQGSSEFCTTFRTGRAPKRNGFSAACLEERSPNQVASDRKRDASAARLLSSMREMP